MPCKERVKTGAELVGARSSGRMGQKGKIGTCALSGLCRAVSMRFCWHGRGQRSLSLSWLVTSRSARAPSEWRVQGRAFTWCGWDKPTEAQWEDLVARPAREPLGVCFCALFLLASSRRLDRSMGCHRLDGSLPLPCFFSLSVKLVSSRYYYSESSFPLFCQMSKGKKKRERPIGSLSTPLQYLVHLAFRGQISATSGASPSETFNVLTQYRVLEGSTSQGLLNWPVAHVRDGQTKSTCERRTHDSRTVCPLK